MSRLRIRTVAPPQPADPLTKRFISGKDFKVEVVADDGTASIVEGVKAARVIASGRYDAVRVELDMVSVDVDVEADDVVKSDSPSDGFRADAYRKEIALLNVDQLRDALVREAELRYVHQSAIQRIEIHVSTNQDPNRIASLVRERLLEVGKLHKPAS